MNDRSYTYAKTHQSKKKILEAALVLFARKGYSATPVSLIAKTAGVSQGLLYNFFSGKDAVLKEIAALGFHHIRLTMQAYKNEADPKKAIVSHIYHVHRELKAHTPFWRMMHIIRLQEDVLAIIGPLSAGIVAEVLKILTNAFTQLRYKQPGMEALLLFSQIDGLVSLYLFNPRVPVKQLCQHIIKHYDL